MRILIIVHDFAGFRLGFEMQTLVQKTQIPAVYVVRKFTVLVLQLAKYVSQR